MKTINTTYRKHYSLAYLNWIFLLLGLNAGAQDAPVQPATKTTIFEHLQQEDYLQVVLESDFKNLIKNKRTNEYQPALLKVKKADGKEESWQTEIQPRGNMRRNVCYVPPLKIRFDEQELKSRGLDKRRTLKMVILCQNGGGYEQFVLKEYMAYRLYNIITDQSFQVQLAKIKYVDTEGNDKGWDESFAFFIEHPKDLADRTEADVIDNSRFTEKLMNTDAGERFAMFQFMIGNTDWYFFNGHNVVVCGVPGTTDLVPLPYDFDYAGIVSTPYAVPNDQLPTKHVAERYYQGYCRSEEETMRTIQLFLDKKQEILAAAESFPYFAGYTRKRYVKYLKNFYRIIEKPKSRKRAIMKHCDKWPVR